ncbi:RNA-dependent ATPase rok1 [Acarospora aff. strigata]|nr:RNA-dependent ATPase rok1 [Acarospora aff. strigata]
MDVFKLLSRSTNLKNTQAVAKQRPTQQLPSNGAAKSPQLYADHNGESRDLESTAQINRSKKRKRGEDEVRSSPDLPAELDFFGEGTGSHETHSRRDRKEVDRRGDVPVADKVERGPLSVKEDGIVDLSEEECKRILKVHKLKITLLDDRKGISDSTSGGAVKGLKKRQRDKTGPESVAMIQGKKLNTSLLPQPLTSFSQLRSRYAISPRLTDNINAQGYTIPTEVQLGGLPLLLAPAQHHEILEPKKDLKAYNNRIGTPPAVDLLTVAPTGSGKTLAFLIPVFHGLLQARRTGSKNSTGSAEKCASYDQNVKAIVVAPTRELADQIVNEGQKLAIGTGIRIAGMRKGMRIAKGDDIIDVGSEGEETDSEHSEVGITQKEENGHKVGPLVKADVLVSTPLMLLHAISKAGSSDIIPLPSVRYLVLDEADVLLDPLFRSQTLGIWNACINHNLRTSLWSATMGSNIEELARSTILTRRETLSIAAPSHLVRLVVGLKDSAIPNISHRLIYAATEQGKLLALRQLLHPTNTTSSASTTSPALRPPFLVFTQTIPRAIALHSELHYDIPPEAGGSSRLAVLHSDLTDTARASIMTRFRAGEIWILITTDLLSRGVDFRGVNGVVNYDVPGSGAAYVHRVGRTGRAGRDGGVAVTLYSREDVGVLRGVVNVIAASDRHNQNTNGNDNGNGQSETQSHSLHKWLLAALPTPSKNAKKELKRRGVEVRRTKTTTRQSHTNANANANANAKRAARISTKSGFDRRRENNRHAQLAAARPAAKHVGLGQTASTGIGADMLGRENGNARAEVEWTGFED